jgi:hypothetical protein
MSAFVLLLAAGLAPGDGPGAVSLQMEQRLNLSWQWEGTSCRSGWSWEVRLVRCLVNRRLGPETFVLVTYRADPRENLALWHFQDEGGGRFCIEHKDRSYLGIYQYKGDWLTPCLRDAEPGRPTPFSAEYDTELLTLRRVRPKK